jgi:hypothetical protein
MIRVITDHNFNGRIIRGLSSRVKKLDLFTARSVGLARSADPDVLAWAAEERRVLFTQDFKTMPVHIRNRAAAGLAHAGVIFVPQLLGLGRAIEALEIIVECTEEHEWTNQVLYVPR